jgi:hypothetical protein
MYNTGRFGGVKVVENAFLILDASSSDLLVYFEAPTEVALAWRDALNNVLASQKRHRPVQQLDWLAIAANVDPTWAKEQGWVPPAAAQEAPPSSALTADEAAKASRAGARPNGPSRAAEA